MVFSWWRTKSKAASGRGTRKSFAARKYTFTPALESLEERTLLTTRSWTGLGGDNLWSDASNWTNGAPQNGDNLIFNNTAGVARLTNVNDFGLTPGTTPLSLNSLSFSGDGGF